MSSRAPGRNWAGNYAYRARAVHRPNSIEQVQEIVSGGAKLHALGSRHSFTDIADSDGELISLDALEPVLDLAADGRSVVVGGGVRYGAVGQFLAGQGKSLRNFASLPHISVAGAVATASHGSGDGNASLAADVSTFDLVLATGEIQQCSPATMGTDFLGAVVNLGALGVVTRVTMEVVPAFEIGQWVYEGLAWSAFDEHFDELTALAYSVSLFTDYRATGIGQVWLKRRTGPNSGPAIPPDLFGARPATERRHPVPGMAPGNTTEQFGIPGPAYDRLPHFRLGHTPSSGAELQSEYLIDRRHVVPVVHALRALSARISPLIQAAEIRTVAGDQLWLSPSRGRDTVALHFTWVPEPTGVASALVDLERALAPFAARPHWGKLFAADADQLRELYPLLPRFRRLVERWDPHGRFRNRFLERYVF